MASLVNHGGDHVVNGTDKGDGTSSLESPTAISRDVNDVTNPFTHLNGHLAKLASHAVNAGVGGTVMAKYPRVAALVCQYKWSIKGVSGFVTYVVVLDIVNVNILRVVGARGE